MAIDFKVSDVIHKITAKFVQAFLPDAKKKYYLKAVLQPELDIHGIASKAEVYNITTPPKVIEEGFLAGAELAFYLLADGYKLKLPFCTMGIRLPGEYDGSETALLPDAYPEVRLQASAAIRTYIKDAVQVAIDGIETSEGFIGEVLDEATGLVDHAVTIDNVMSIHGYGLKVMSDTPQNPAVGVFFETAGGQAIPAKALAVNEPRLLKIITPPTLAAGTDYVIRITTQASVKSHGCILKNPRTIRSEFTLTAQT